MIANARIIQDEIIQLLRLGSFEFSKWASNCPKLIEDIANQSHKPVIISDDTTSRILEMKWDQTKNTFQISFDARITTLCPNVRYCPELLDCLTLSDFSVLLSLQQSSCYKNCGSREVIGTNPFHTRWSKFRWQLADLRQLQVPRCVKFVVNPQLIQVHGFYDASQCAYKAYIYV